jgi:hypothetical protein
LLQAIDERLVGVERRRVGVTALRPEGRALFREGIVTVQHRQVTVTGLCNGVTPTIRFRALTPSVIKSTTPLRHHDRAADAKTCSRWR